MKHASSEFVQKYFVEDIEAEILFLDFESDEPPQQIGNTLCIDLGWEDWKKLRMYLF